MSFNWDNLTETEMFHYVLGSRNHICFSEGWDWSFPTYYMPYYIYFKEEEE